MKLALAEAEAAEAGEVPVGCVIVAGIRSFQRAKSSS